MPYFHVVVEGSDASSKPVAIFMDLSLAELKAKFLKPYENGSDLLSGSSIYSTRTLRKVSVIETENRSEVELAELQRTSSEHIDELNRNSSIVFVSLGRGHDPKDIVERGADVTHKIVKGPPGGNATGLRVSALLNNGWVVGIGGGLVVSVLVWFFKLN